jgi:hypothetical protein
MGLAVLLLAALNEFFDFAAIQPDAMTSGALVNCNALTFGHDKVDAVADRALHDFTSWQEEKPIAKSGCGVIGAVSGC